MTNVTKILSAVEQGDSAASAELLPLVYDELRRLAARELRGDSSGNSVQPTALVHEAYVRLVDQDDEPRWNHRGHFYAAAAEAMRRILVEHARRKQTLKRGGDRKRLPLDEQRDQAPQRDTTDLLALDDALTRLAVDRPKLARRRWRMVRHRTGSCRGDGLPAAWWSIAKVMQSPPLPASRNRRSRIPPTLHTP